MGVVPKSKPNWQPFIPVPKAAFDDQRLGKGHLLVLFSLCSFMNAQTRKCFPSIAAVAQGARMSAPRTRQKINDLAFSFIAPLRSYNGNITIHYLLRITNDAS